MKAWLGIAPANESERYPGKTRKPGQVARRAIAKAIALPALFRSKKALAFSKCSRDSFSMTFSVTGPVIPGSRSR